MLTFPHSDLLPLPAQSQITELSCFSSLILGKYDSFSLWLVSHIQIVSTSCPCTSTEMFVYAPFFSNILVLSPGLILLSDPPTCGLTLQLFPYIPARYIFLEQLFSEWHLQTSSISTTRKFAKNAKSRTPPKTYFIRSSHQSLF